MSRYGELLKDPRWQRKRLEIMERDNFTCQRCGVMHVTLNVHHMWYSKIPWDVPNSLLITLCEGCHKIEESIDGMKAHKMLKAVSESGVPKYLVFELIAAALDRMPHPASRPAKRFLQIIEHVKSFK